VSAFAPERIFAALRAEGVGSVTVGGIALIAHGVVHATVAVDTVPSPEPDHLARLARVIRSLDGVPYGEPDTAVTPELLARDANMRFDTDAGQLDILASEPYRRLPRSPGSRRRSEPGRGRDRRHVAQRPDPAQGRDRP
jgi:hypothetical protein